MHTKTYVQLPSLQSQHQDRALIVQLLWTLCVHIATVIGSLSDAFLSTKPLAHSRQQWARSENEPEPQWRMSLLHE